MFTLNHVKKTFRIFISGCILATSLTLIAPTIANATDECIGTTTNGHGSDSESGDCVDMNVYTATDGRIIVKYWGNQDFDFYQLRWSRSGLAETQQRVRGSGARGSWWALNNPRSNTRYTFKVQACYSGMFGSDCTPWEVTTYVK